MASKLLLLTVVVAVLVGYTYGVPVPNEGEQKADDAIDANKSADVVDEPQGTVFNYELPSEDELNPSTDDLSDEAKRMLELQPPAIDSHVTFYEKPVKPKKGGSKKYNPDEKWINKRPELITETDEGLTIDGRTLLDMIIQNFFAGWADQMFVNAQALEKRRIDDAEAESEGSLATNGDDYVPNPHRRVDDEFDGADERVTFQVHGHLGGPGSYKFGYDTETTDNSDSKSKTTRADSEASTAM